MLLEITAELEAESPEAAIVVATRQITCMDWTDSFLEMQIQSTDVERVAETDADQDEYRVTITCNDTLLDEDDLEAVVGYVEQSYLIESVYKREAINA